MASVVIPAHNEAAVIGRCLEALWSGDGSGDLDITVVANGCTDDTAARAAAYPGVRVLDLPNPGKVEALNAGDAVAQGFPRAYVDADVVVTGAQLRLLCESLTTGSPPPEVVVPRRELDVTGRPLAVRAYYAIHRRLPAFDDGLFGCGVIVLSESARARFDRFPEVVADDLFLDALFARGEKRQVVSVTSVVATPRRTRDLVRRLTRVRRGNAELRATGLRGCDVQNAGTVRPAARLAWLTDVVLPSPWLAPAAVCYVTITVLAAWGARRPAEQGREWPRDDSSRQGDLSGGARL